MLRHFARIGDKTTAGGDVLEGEPTFTFEGRPVAFHGAKVYCAACNSTGVIVTIPPYHPFTTKGRQLALNGDLCVCKCGTPPRLIASQTSGRMSFDRSDSSMASRDGESRWAELAAAALASAAHTRQDEDARMAEAAYGDPRLWTAQVGPPLPGPASAASRTQLVRVDLPGLGASYLDESFAVRVEQFISGAASRGVDLHFNSAFRTPEHQAALRNDPTAITPADTSLHSCGFAVDVNYSVLPAAQQQIIRDAASAAGLSWGGDFRTPDPPHFFMEAPIDRAAAVDNAVRQYNEMTAQQ
jgi:uncharacterized Zn-binding protein involved in type VI secretion